MDVHEEITVRVIEQNIQKFNNYFKDLGFVDGIEGLVNKRQIRKWIEEGSWKEDFSLDPEVLLTSHYHNPLTNKGLTKGGITIGESAYDRANNSANYWSWKSARANFFKGLTSSTQFEREIFLAYSFKALGHLIHLVQDMAVPAHTRDDMHMPSIDTEPYEAYTHNNRGKLNYRSVPFPYWNVSISPSAPKQFWDLDSYDGSTAYDGGYIGLSEYSHANFFSKNTILKYFPHPAKENTNYDDFGLLPRTVITTPDKINHNTFYIEGYGKKHLAALKYFAEELWKLPIPWQKKYQLTLHLDNRCHEEYAQHLVPRAVGYSAGLLDYFFRGKLEVIPVGPDRIKIKNLSSEAMNGGFYLYYDAIDGNRKLVRGGSWSLSLAASEISEALNFTEPTDVPESGKYILVFRGKLGNESDAVVGKVWQMEKYHWAVVINEPPWWSYNATYTEVPGTWRDCGTIAGSMINRNVIANCPEANLKVYLLASDQPFYDAFYRLEGCEGNLRVAPIGQFRKKDVFSKVEYYVNTCEIYWRQVVDDLGLFTCQLTNGITAYAMDSLSIITESPWSPLSWAELPTDSPELDKIKNALSSGRVIKSLFKSDNFSDGIYNTWTFPLGSFSYPVTLFLNDHFPTISENESRICYCWYYCDPPGFPDFCVTKLGIYGSGPVEMQKYVYIRIRQ